VNWLLPCLTVLLAALAVYQLVYLVPRCSAAILNLEGREPGPLRFLRSFPEWAPPVAALAFGAVVLWQRASVARSALLATLAVAINVAALLCIVNALSQTLSRMQSP
jgi:hypothetical protein